MNRNRLSAWAGFLIFLLFVSGCSARPFLTQDSSYSIIKISPDGEVQKTPIHLTLKSNAAVMKGLLLEASFVLSDLHTQMLDLNPETQSIEDSLPPKDQLLTPESISLKTEVKANIFQESTQTTDNNPFIQKDKLLISVENLNQKGKLQATDDKPTSKNTSQTNDDQSLLGLKNSITPNDDSFAEMTPVLSRETILLEATFPEPKKFKLKIDDEILELEIVSVQIEVQGKKPGRVILNEVLTLQGIPNPNLYSAYKDFNTMLSKIQREARD